jgi:hypothetical protein
MADLDPREFGKLEAEVSQLKEIVSEIRTDLKEVKDGWNKASGGLKVLLATAAILGGLMTQFINWIAHKI